MLNGLHDWLKIRNTNLLNLILSQDRLNIYGENVSQVVFTDVTADSLFGPAVKDVISSKNDPQTQYGGILNYPVAEELHKRIVDASIIKDDRGVDNVCQLVISVLLHDPHIGSITQLSAALQAACTALSGYHGYNNLLKRDSNTLSHSGSKGIDHSNSGSNMLNNLFGTTSKSSIGGYQQSGSSTDTNYQINIEFICGPSIPEELVLAVNGIVDALNNQNDSASPDEALFYSRGRPVSVMIEETLRSIDNKNDRKIRNTEKGRSVSVHFWENPMFAFRSQICKNLWITGHKRAFEGIELEKDKNIADSIGRLLKSMKDEIPFINHNWEAISIGKESKAVLESVHFDRKDHLKNHRITTNNGNNSRRSSRRESLIDTDDDEQNKPIFSQLQIGRISVTDGSISEQQDGRGGLTAGHITSGTYPSRESDVHSNDRDNLSSVGLLMIDRKEDLVTPLLLPYTLGGLIDHFLHVNVVTREIKMPAAFAPMSFRRAPSSADEYHVSSSALYPKLAKGLLPDCEFSDQVLKLHHGSVGAELRSRLVSIQNVYDSREGLKGLKELKEYMPEFKAQQQMHTAVSDILHLATITTGLSFKNPLFAEQLTMESKIRSINPSVISKVYLKDTMNGEKTVKRAESSYLHQEFISGLPYNVGSEENSNIVTYPDLSVMELKHVNNAEVESLDIGTIIVEILMDDFNATRINPRTSLNSNDVNDLDNLPYVECMAKAAIGHPAASGLALLCKVSHILGGVPLHVIDHVSETMFMLYGLRSQVWMERLIRSGLFTPLSSQPFNWYLRRRRFNLIEELKNKTTGDILSPAYALDGLVPMITRLLENLITTTNDGKPMTLEPLVNDLHLFCGPCCETGGMRSPQLDNDDVSDRSPRIWVVLMIGGISLSEYYSLQRLADLKEKELLVISTHTINCRSLVEEIMGEELSMNLLPNRS